MEKGTYVSRAVYAKLQAENKRIKQDIKILALKEFFLTEEYTSVCRKWRETLLAEQDFENMIHTVCRQMNKDELEQNGMLKDLEEFDNHPQL